MLRINAIRYMCTLGLIHFVHLDSDTIHFACLFSYLASNIIIYVFQTIIKYELSSTFYVLYIVFNNVSLILLVIKYQLFAVHYTVYIKYYKIRIRLIIDTGVLYANKQTKSIISRALSLKIDFFLGFNFYIWF